MPYAPGTTYQTPHSGGGGGRLGLALLQFFMQQGERKAAETQERDYYTSMLGQGQPGAGVMPEGNYGAPWASRGPQNFQNGEEAGGQEKQQQALKQAAQLTDAYRKVSVLQHGMDPNLAKTMSLGELKGRVGRMQLDQAMAEQRLKAQQIQAGIQDALARKDYYRQRQARDIADRSAMTKFGTAFAQEPPMALRPDLLEERRSLAGRTRFATAAAPEALGNPNLDNFLSAMSRVDPSQRGWNLNSGEAVTVDGVKGLPTSQHSIQWLTNPSKADPTIQHPALYTDDPEKFKSWAMSLTPAERDQAFKTRNALRTSLGQNDPVQKMIDEFNAAEARRSGAPGPAAPPKAPKAKAKRVPVWDEENKLWYDYIGDGDPLTDRDPNNWTEPE